MAAAYSGNGVQTSFEPPFRFACADIEFRYVDATAAIRRDLAARTAAADLATIALAGAGPVEATGQPSMRRHTAVAALLLLLGVAGCAPIGAAPAPPHAPHSPDNSDSMHGGGDGGGGSGSR